jgi:hypothetical protein
MVVYSSFSLDAAPVLFVPFTSLFWRDFRALGLFLGERSKQKLIQYKSFEMMKNLL